MEKELCKVVDRFYRNLESGIEEMIKEGFVNRYDDCVDDLLDAITRQREKLEGIDNGDIDNENLDDENEDDEDLDQ